MKKYKDIVDLIVGEEAAFTEEIDINGWQWNFKDHIKTSFYYKHGRLLNGNDENTPVKNITRPILNLQYRAEDIDVKDIVLYVDDPDSYHLSFLVKKYHDDVFVVENDLDTFLDEWKESKIDYGVGLIKKGQFARPEVVDLQSIAFCDQTDMLKGPLAFKHYYNPAELKDMEAVGWGSEANGATGTIDDLIAMSENAIQYDKTEGTESKTPGNYIEIYEVHGVLPESFLTDQPSTKYKRQFQIVGLYKNKNLKKEGVVLFRKEQKVSQLKTALRDKVFSRCAGFGGAEELFEPQVWTNYSVIRQKDMLDAASKVILKSVGTDVKSRYPQGLKNMDNLDIVELNAGEDLQQVDTTPRSLQLFDNFEQRLKEHAQETGSAFDPLLGKDAPSGTPFRAQERQVFEGKGIHEYRRGKFAKDVEWVYQNWIIPHIVDEITKGTRFLSELTTEEMQYVADRLVENQAKRFVIEKLFSLQVVTKQDVEFLKAQVREDFMKGGNKRFLEILKGEFKKKPVRVKVNVAGKQKDLSLMTDKLVNIFRQIIANPQGFQQVMQIPEMAKTFNDILEYSGLTPVYYSGVRGSSQGQQTVPTQTVEAELQTTPAPAGV